MTTPACPTPQQPQQPQPPYPEKVSMFEKHGQSVLSSVVLAAILWVGSSVRDLEKQAIRSEAQASVNAIRNEQFSKTLEALAVKVDALQARQDAMALEAAKKNQ